MTKLHDLYDLGGQSPWIDNLKRSYVTSGRLAELIDQGIRGLTSNPTIMAKAIEAASDYDEQFAESMERHGDVLQAYWDLVVTDVTHALELFTPVHERSGGTDGYVSIEVAPDLARDTDGTIEAARHLHARIARSNVLVKIPATSEGLPAIRQMISEGRSINVTLIFSIKRYEEVIEAYLGGLEELAAAGGELSSVASVASFFVSRVDTETDRRLEALAADDPESALAAKARSLLGATAVAQARLAYETFRRRFHGDRWDALAAQGARPQRPLWASTSTKNPAYPDLAYVDTLIAPHTVNTMPEETVEKFADHGRVAVMGEEEFSRARLVLEGLESVGVDLEDVAEVLEDEGVTAFAKSFDE
ncbi:MAG TPA: transaldolase, partial [Acidimicrobiales bacterium]|nr:transaldolase [Acidimicrobiales bacterium]